MKSEPVLTGLSLADTVIDFGKKYIVLKNWADVVLGQFGIGADGHIAGVLPGTVGTDSLDIACGYEAVNFTRLSLTLNTFKKIDLAYVFVLGNNKKEIVEKLLNTAVPVTIMPAQILKSLPEVFLCSDSV